MSFPRRASARSDAVIAAVCQLVLQKISPLRMIVTGFPKQLGIFRANQTSVEFRISRAVIRNRH